MDQFEISLRRIREFYKRIEDGKKKTILIKALPIKRKRKRNV